MISLEQIRIRAKALGLSDIESLGKADLIRAIQEKEGHDACYNAPWCNLCEREGCCWREGCRSVGIYF